MKNCLAAMKDAKKHYINTTEFINKRNKRNNNNQIFYSFIFTYICIYIPKEAFIYYELKMVTNNK